MKEEGTALPLMLIAISVGIISVKYIFDEGSRYVSIANAQRAVEAAANAGATTYSRALTEDLRKCIKEKYEEEYSCTFGDDVKSCMDTNLKHCAEETKECIMKARDNCKDKFDNMKVNAVGEARSAAKKGAESMSAKLIDFNANTETAEIKVEIELNGKGLYGDTYSITRKATAVDKKYLR